MALKHQLKKRGCFIIAGLIAFAAAALAWVFMRPIAVLPPPDAPHAETQPRQL